MDCSPPGSSVQGDSPGKNTGVGCQAFLQGIFPTLGSNQGLLHCRQTFYHLSHQGRTDAFELWCWRRLLSHLDSKEIKLVHLKGDKPWIFTVHWKDWCWSWSSSILVIWCEWMTHWKSSWCWERLRAKGEGVRGRDSWTASLMQWTWTWANSGRWWGTGRPGVLQSVGFQRVGHDWATEQQ